LATGGTATFTLGGGTAPYDAVTNNTAVATVSQPTPTTVLITGVAAGAATVTMTDAKGAVLSVDVHVNAGAGAVTLFTTAPSTVSVAVSTSQTFTVGGGTGTYTITNTNPFNVSAVVSGAGPAGGSLTITGLLVGSSTLTVRDAAGSQVVITVNVIQPGSTLTLLPATLSIDETNGAEIDLSIFGGVAPYRAFTTNAKLATVNVVGATLQVTAVPPAAAAAPRCVNADTPVTLTVLDSLGASATSTLTVVNTDPTACP
jgi:hypothetical protein